MSSSHGVDHPESGAKPSHNVVLVSIDGWGLSAEKHGNAILNANTPNMDRLSKESLHARLDASGLSVGLPAGVMGNSEVGHLTMGAGRVEFQDLVRINQSIEDGVFAKNATTLAAAQRAKAGNGRVHLLGLISDGAVHSHIQHLFRFLEVFQAQGVPNAYIHFFADGRDTPPTTGVKYVQEVAEFTKKLKYGTLSTLQGRYFAMDRDKRWDRVQIAYEALVTGKGEKVEQIAADKLLETMEKRYKDGEKDEFLRPIVLDTEGKGNIQDGDTLLFINFRSDRMREITSIFARCTKDAKEDAANPWPFKPSVQRSDLHVVGMTQYDEKVSLPVVFAPQTMVNGLAEWLSRHAGVTQFHTAETEKYAHVTFFFAGGVEKQFQGEERAMIQSPKVATYDLAPEMAQKDVADSVIHALEQNKYNFILCNFAAPDMVGHTGHYDPAVKACEACDVAIGRIASACEKAGWTLVVTADHGNAEEMFAEDGKSPKTSHTTNLIPLIVHPSGNRKDAVKWGEDVSKAAQNDKKPAGGLSDVAPTVLALMGLKVPKEMTGKPLIVLA